MAAVHADHPVAASVALHDRDRARLDREEVVVRLALAEEDLAGLDGSNLADCAQPLALPLGQARERAVAIDGLGSARPQRFSDHHRPAAHEFTMTNISSST